MKTNMNGRAWVVDRPGVFVQGTVVNRLSVSIVVMGLLLPLQMLVDPSSIFAAASSNSTLQCAAGLVACKDNSKCLQPSEVCDRIPHCYDGSDERGCALNCQEDEIECVPESSCLPVSYRCDKASDCSDDSDEANCGDVTCEEFEFRCVEDNICINKVDHCNGKPHCPDGSDERDCPDRDYEGCDKAEFDCLGNGTECIPLLKYCDSHVDCVDGQDENATVCSAYEKSVMPGVAGEPLADDTSKEEVVEVLTECEDSNACAHHCDLIDGQDVCGCQNGYHLGPDGGSCLVDGTEPKLLFGNKSQLVRYGLRSGDKKSIGVGGRVHGITYDFETGMIFLINHDIPAITSLHQDLVHEPSVLLDKFIQNPVSLAYDWVHNNLYWADVSPHAGGSYARIEVVAMTRMYRTTILSFPDIRNPRQLVVDPRTDRGHLYWTEVGTSAAIRRSGLDGFEPIDLVTSDIQQPNGLCIDYLTNRLYWIDSHLMTIVEYNLYSNDRRVLVNLEGQRRHPTSLDVFEDFLYWADEVQKSLYQRYVLESDPRKAPNVLLTGVEDTKDVFVLHNLKYKRGNDSLGTNFCGTNNGGCSHVCLPSPHLKRFRCACPNVDKMVDNYELDAEAKTCILKEVTQAPSSKNKLAPNVDRRDPQTKTNVKPGGSLNSDIGSGAPGSGGSNLMVILGAVIGVVIVLVTIAVIVVVVLRRNKANRMQFGNTVPESKPLKNGIAA